MPLPQSENDPPVRKSGAKNIVLVFASKTHLRIHYSLDSNQY
jgi:hypothetical protein